MTSGSRDFAFAILSAIRLPLLWSGHRRGCTGCEQLVHDRGQPSGAVVSRRSDTAVMLIPDEQRHIIADCLPVPSWQGERRWRAMALMWTGESKIPADGRARDDSVLEGLARQQIERLQVLAHDLHRPPAGSIGHLHASSMAGIAAQPAATFPAPRRARSWSRRCPWCCSGPPMAPTKPRDQRTRAATPGRVLLTRPPHHSA